MTEQPNSRMVVENGSPRALWRVAQTSNAAGSEPAAAPVADDDDRLLGVIAAAIRERAITGTQGDRLLALWLETP